MPTQGVNAELSTPNANTTTEMFSNMYPISDSGAAIDDCINSPDYSGGELNVGDAVICVNDELSRVFFKGLACTKSAPPHGTYEKFIELSTKEGISRENADREWCRLAARDCEVALVATKLKKLRPDATKKSFSRVISGTVNIQATTHLSPGDKLCVGFMSHSERKDALRTRGPSQRAGGSTPGSMVRKAQLAACHAPILVPMKPTTAAERKMARIAFNTDAVMKASKPAALSPVAAVSSSDVVRSAIEEDVRDSGVAALHAMFTLLNVCGFMVTTRENIQGPGLPRTQDQAFLQAPGNVNTDAPLGFASECASVNGTAVQSLAMQERNLMAMLGVAPVAGIKPLDNKKARQVLAAASAIYNGMDPFTGASVIDAPLDVGALWKGKQLVTPAIQGNDFIGVNRQVRRAIKSATEKDTWETLNDGKVFATVTHNRRAKPGDIVSVYVHSDH